MIGTERNFLKRVTMISSSDVWWIHILLLMHRNNDSVHVYLLILKISHVACLNGLGNILGE